MRVDIVALVRLAGTVEDEAPRLAGDVGITAYEAALLLRTPMPVIVLRSEDRTRTLGVLGKLSERGHYAVACDLAAVAPSSAMFRPRSFRFEGRHIVGVVGHDERRLALANVIALVRAMHAYRDEQTVVDTQRKFSLGRTALTGGLIPVKTTTKQSTRVTNERDAVLYVFSDEAAPWLLASSELRYDGLGDRLAVSTPENFDILTRRLRESAPGATFDARLMQARAGTEVQFSTSSATATDVLAHLVGMSIARARPQPR